MTTITVLVMDNKGAAATATAIASISTGTAWPDATNTGVPVGTVLTPSSGITLSTPGQVVSGLDISGGVRITASNVTLQRSRIKAATDNVILVADGGNVTIQDCEVNGLGTVSGATGIANWSGMSGTKYLRNNIYGVENGIVPSNGDLVQDNYIHDLNAPGSPHYDGIQMDNGSNIDIEHNTVINPWGWTSAVMVANDLGSVSNIKVNNNRLIGGGFTVYADGHFSPGHMSGVSFTNNRMGKGQFGYCDDNDGNAAWSGNVDDVTGLPVAKG